MTIRSDKPPGAGEQVIARSSLNDEVAITDGNYRWKPMLADFIASVRQGRIVGRLSSAEDGLLTQAVIGAAYQSCRERKEVRCELLAGEIGK